ncbi:MAG: metallophosphoesterase [Kiritimatiellae bacterium]|nr:metallophosphoesterase [Kiritimatiellia bacterium]
MKYSRREFLGLTSYALGTGLLPGCLHAAKDGNSYSVALLGDTHYDSPDPKFYHADYTHSTSKGRYEAHLKEHLRNAEMWKERMPALIHASASCATQDTAFILQMGDLIQGDCGNPATHRRMLNDAFETMKGAYGGKLPLVTVAGNHDIRGDVPEDGALAAFDAWQPPLMTRELGVPVTKTTFAFRHGPDVFLVVDFNEPRPNLGLVKSLLKANADARYTFLISHGPAIPNCRSRWFLLGLPKRDAARRELRALLAARNAIVLAGHTHCLESYDCVFPEGRITQFVANSVWAVPEWESLNVREEGKEMFGSQASLKKVKENSRTGTQNSLRQLADEYRPFIRDYFFANAAGHYRLEVSDRRVAVIFYGGSSRTPARTFLLRNNVR